MKNKKKFIMLILIFFIIIAVMPITCLAINTEDFKPGNLTSGNVVSDMGNMIIGVIQVIGIIISVIMLMVLGIKYMVGSVEEKANYKKSMIPYLVGAVLLFAASAVVKLLYNIGMGFTNN